MWEVRAGKDFCACQHIPRFDGRKITSLLKIVLSDTVYIGRVLSNTSACRVSLTCDSGKVCGPTLQVILSVGLNWECPHEVSNFVSSRLAFKVSGSEMGKVVRGQSDARLSILIRIWMEK